MRELIARKDEMVAQRATPPYYLNVRSHPPFWHALCKRSWPQTASSTPPPQAVSIQWLF